MINSITKITLSSKLQQPPLKSFTSSSKNSLIGQLVDTISLWKRIIYNNNIIINNRAIIIIMKEEEEEEKGNKEDEGWRKGVEYYNTFTHKVSIRLLYIK